MSLPKRYNLPLLNTAQIRALETALFQTQDSYAVMQQAAHGLFDVITQSFPPPQTVCIVLGAGNNAGDGLVVAGLLKQAGYNVTAYTVFDKDFTGDAETAYQFAQNQSVTIQPFFDTEQPFHCDADTLIIDAIFGIGLNRAPDKVSSAAIQTLNQSQNRHVFAIDMPSGVATDTGTTVGAAVIADTTVTFIADKIGLHTSEGKQHTGTVIVKDLNAPTDTVTAQSHRYHYTEPTINRHQNAHKGSYGHALIVGGGQGMFGAAALAAVSSLKVGTGKASIYAHADYASQYHLAHTPLYEVMRCQQLNDFSTYTALVLGTGLGQDCWGEQTFLDTINQRSAKQPLLIDADGLWHLATHAVSALDVITPHEAEAAKLLHCSVNTIRADKPSAVRELATRYQCIAVLKGAGTLISDGTTVWINTTGNINLATAGTGDVLAGMIGGYLAQGLPALDASLYGVYQHGHAADAYWQHHKNKTMRASDLWKYF